MIYLPKITYEIVELLEWNELLIKWNPVDKRYEWTQFAVDFVSILKEKEK